MAAVTISKDINGRWRVRGVSSLTRDERHSVLRAFAGHVGAYDKDAVATSCLYCGRDLEGSPVKMYCSPSHRVMASRKRVLERV